MDDYISRKELIEHIKAHCKYCDGCGEVIHCAIDTPAADVKPVRHGHWIEWAEFFGQETDKKNLGVFAACVGGTLTISLITALSAGQRWMEAMKHEA